MPMMSCLPIPLEKLTETGNTLKKCLCQYGLRLNLKKTEYLEKSPSSCTIEVDGKELNKTDCFRYLGPCLRSDGGMESETRARIKAA